jgi:succinate dehydrogenase/fumarate reductase flavoprotein subunit
MPRGDQQAQYLRQAMETIAQKDARIKQLEEGLRKALDAIELLRMQLADTRLFASPEVQEGLAQLLAGRTVPAQRGRDFPVQADRAFGD